MEFIAGPEILGLLFLVALVAGCIDAIAGGGGLLTVPVLLSVGVPPAQTLATNKLQGTFGSLAASITFIRRGEIDLRAFWPFIAATLVGAVIGTIGVRMIDASALARMIPVLLVGVALYVLLSPRAGDIEAHRRVSDIFFIALVAPLIGAYDGFFGPGTGSFFAIAFVALLGHSLRRATAHAKVLNFTSNIASLAVFIGGGHVVWVIGGVMALGQLIGAQVGAQLVVKVGARIVRPVLVVMSVALALKLLLWG
ncbi:TSUP family transporter [Zavarzinia compransoris]|uniref:Probable membrane transporter protein n=1 Tax=Zavarzinia compransoris TaxID=1264899 RepID=A0A317EAI5_9PROT|nr:TSUP family transporter [Zavarzinia compransoris]PWR22195.1 hypothetical protein DKG75_09520 [Zavarzinia compransoris]TDP47052.1 hypothetical protein DES42_103220 [Zavarzinia compransoris]